MFILGGGIAAGNKVLPDDWLPSATTKQADIGVPGRGYGYQWWTCLLYTSDAADERSSVDLGGRRIITKKTKQKNTHTPRISLTYRHRTLRTLAYSLQPLSSCDNTTMTVVQTSTLHSKAMNHI